MSCDSLIGLYYFRVKLHQSSELYISIFVLSAFSGISKLVFLCGSNCVFFFPVCAFSWFSYLQNG